MMTPWISARRRLLSQWWLVGFFFLAGCLPEELAEPGKPIPPAPELPSLLCQPFIKSGYTERVSYFPGETMRIFFESTQSTDLCRLTLYSLAGDSVFSTTSALPLVSTIPGDASEHGFDYPVAVEFFVPPLPSGVYMVEKQIPFIIKTNSPVDMLVVYASNTANAYAESGGKSLYSSQDRPAGLSFHRPIPLEPFSEVCLKWFANLEGIDIGYVADVDMEFYETISHTKVLVIPGHSEYWTRQGRLNFDRFVEEGGHALILSGNTMWWQVRYSEDMSRMICHKNKDTDPIGDERFKTINWNEPSLNYSILESIGAHFPLGGYGLKNDSGWNGMKIAAPESPLFEGLALKKGDTLKIPTVEYDGAPLIGYDDDGYPILDVAALGFEKAELLAFDKGFRVQETAGTFIVFKKTATSGVVINTATTDWCSSNGMGGASGNAIKAITYNAIRMLVNNENVFSD